MRKLQETIAKLRKLVESDVADYDLDHLTLGDLLTDFSSTLEGMLISAQKADQDADPEAPHKFLAGAIRGLKHKFDVIDAVRDEFYRRKGAGNRMEDESDLEARLRLSDDLGTCVGALLYISDRLKDLMSRKNQEDIRPALLDLQGYAQGTAAKFKVNVEGSVPLSGDHRAE